MDDAAIQLADRRWRVVTGSCRNYRAICQTSGQQPLADCSSNVLLARLRQDGCPQLELYELGDGDLTVSDVVIDTF